MASDAERQHSRQTYHSAIPQVGRGAGPLVSVPFTSPPLPCLPPSLPQLLQDAAWLAGFQQTSRWAHVGTHAAEAAHSPQHYLEAGAHPK